MPYVSLFIIISAAYATSVPVYLKTWPKWLHALVGSRLDYANSVLFGATQKNISKLQKAQNLLAPVVTCSPVLLNPAVHVGLLSSSSSTGSQLNTASTSK